MNQNELLAEAQRRGLIKGGPIPEITVRPRGAEPPPASDGGRPGMGSGLARSFIGQGLAAGFGDEIEAFARSRSNGTPYEQELQTVRAEIEQFGEDHPVLSTASEIAGAISGALVPVGAAVRGAGLAGRVGRGMIAGAGYGAVEGFGKGEGGFEQRATSAGVSGATGAVAGAAAPLAIAGAVGAKRLAGEGVRRVAGNVRGALNPGAEASRRVALAQETDRAMGQGLPDAAFAGAQGRGQPVANIDRGGETTRALARSAANTSPQGRAMLDEAVSDRFASQGDRATQMIRRLVVGTDATTTRDALKDAAKRANAPLYRAAYEAGDRPIRAEGLDRLMTAPAVANAMALASRQGQNRAVAEGFGGFNTAVTVTDDGRVLFRSGKSGAPTYPNLAFWDETKRILDDAVGAAQRTGRNAEARRLTQIAKALRDELDKAVPQYRNARGTAASFFNAEDALEAGQNFAKAGRMSIPEARKAFNKLSDPEKKLFREGFAAELVETLNKTADSRDVVKRIFASKDARDRIRLAFGDEGFRRMEAFMRVEAYMNAAKAAVQGNSTTARQLAELGLAGGTGAGGYALTTGDTSTQGLALAALAGGFAKRRIDRNVAERVAKLLVSEDPVQVSRGIQQIASRPKLMEALRSLDVPASIGGAVLAPNEF